MCGPTSRSHRPLLWMVCAGGLMSEAFPPRDLLENFGKKDSQRSRAEIKFRYVELSRKSYDEHCRRDWQRTKLNHHSEELDGVGDFLQYLSDTLFRSSSPSCFSTSHPGVLPTGRSMTETSRFMNALLVFVCQKPQGEAAQQSKTSFHSKWCPEMTTRVRECEPALCCAIYSN